MLLLIPLIQCGFQSAAAQEVAQESSDTIDEIVVEGRQTLIRLRMQVYEAEDRFYELFNTLNDDDEFDVICRKEAKIGSHILRHVCKPTFERKADAADARMLGLDAGVVYGAPVILEKRAELREKMEALVSEHPDLLDALTDLDDARRTFEAERASRYAD